MHMHMHMHMHVRGCKEELRARLNTPKMALSVNGGENDILCVTTKQQHLGGTISDKRRDTCDVMPGLVSMVSKLRPSNDDPNSNCFQIKSVKSQPVINFVNQAPSWRLRPETELRPSVRFAA